MREVIVQGDVNQYNILIAVRKIRTALEIGITLKQILFLSHCTQMKNGLPKSIVATN